MESLIQLNLRSDKPNPEPDNPPDAERKDEEAPVLMSKRLHRLMNKAAHKAAADLNRNRTGIFSK